MTTPTSSDGPEDAGPEDRPARPPVYKEPPFLAGVVILVGLAAAVGLLSLLERGGPARLGELDPTPAFSPTAPVVPEPSPTPAPTPSPVASPVAPASPSPTPDRGPQAPELPEEDPDVVVGQGPPPVAATGRGPGRTPVIRHQGGLAVIRVAHAGEGKFRAELVDRRGVGVKLGAAGEDGSVLVAAEGRYEGSRALVLPAGRYRVAITASGTWGARWQQPRYQRAPRLPVTRSAPADAATTPFTVTGPSVELAWRLKGDEAEVRVINVVGAVAAELTVADGDTTVVDGLGGGLYLLDVRADDRWRVEVR